MITDSQLADIIVRKVPDLIGIWLYGSVAKGMDAPDSDLDIAILTQSPLPFDKRLSLSAELERQTRRDVDLVDLHTASTVLRKEIIANGKRIHCREEHACETFEDFVYSDYARLNEERAGILEDIFRRGSIHG
ncbi:MAG: nucleotidyltransferase domain-containing protein [Gammaproteobacteria bacterium]|nr:nucleotidyltransferase domain-containing protein [Gammaproteobacteria bacterium]MCW8993441.1 nucleotidyltransferase domain-containing protein [Gammaproteobacteria bacterium]